MKKKRIHAVFLLFTINALVIGAQEKIIKDDLGFPHTLISPPQRIISLAPNITEILFTLGSGEKVVGVTRYCDYPEEAIKREKVGGLVDPNLEKIIALNPDLIIGFRGNPLRTLERLRNMNLPVFVLEMGTDIESVFRLIEKIGIITHNEKKAQLTLQSLKAKYSGILSALRNVRHEPKVFLSLHGMELWTCGKKSFLNDLINKARGVNIAGEIPMKWLNYNREQLIHENPEVIVVLSKSKQDFLNAKMWIINQDSFGEIKAVTDDRIYFLDENLATRPGPRLIQALDELAHLLHPRCFDPES